MADNKNGLDEHLTTDEDNANKILDQIKDAEENQKGKDNSQEDKEDDKNNDKGKGDNSNNNNADNPASSLDKDDNSTPDQTQDALNDQQANLDGIANETVPYTTSNVIQRWTQQFTATFSTQIGDTTVSYVIGRENNSVDLTKYSNLFEDELLAFQTTVDKNQDTPTFQLTLLGSRDWEDILLVNDYVSVGVERWGSNGTHDMTTLITGLISDVRKNTDSSSNQRTYTIVCQGMEKILENINLATLTELKSYQAYLLYDIGIQGEGFDPHKNDGGSDDGEGGSDTTSKGEWISPVGTGGHFMSGQNFGDSSGRSNVHDGIDFGSNMGWSHKIKAAHSGEVVYTGYDADWAHGMIVIRSGDIWHCYQEYSNNWTADTLVKKGDKVEKGDHIANMTNDHLHFGMTKGGASVAIAGSNTTSGFLNPKKYLPV